MSKPVDLDKLRSISISCVAVPSRRRAAAASAVWHSHNEADVPAYRRLRAEGLQPQSVHGAAWLEQHADTPEHVEGPISDLPDGLEWEKTNADQ